MKLFQRTVSTFISSLLILIFLTSCQMEVASRTSVNEKELTDRMIAMVDRELDNVIPYIEEDLPSTRSLEDVNARSIVMKTLEEEQGKRYLEFCYQIDTAATPEEVVKAAEGLISEEDMAMLKAKVQELETKTRTFAEERARTLTGQQQREFYRDLRVLVVKATVLFTAGIVYACIPNTVWWGKITAACAVAVAAGIVAAAILSVVEYYKVDGATLGSSFEGWIDSITKEPYTDWALAASIIATGKTMKRSPALTGVIICVFGLYKVVDELKPMMKKYNLSF